MIIAKITTVSKDNTTIRAVIIEIIATTIGKAATIAAVTTITDIIIKAVTTVITTVRAVIREIIITTIVKAVTTITERDVSNREDLKTTGLTITEDLITEIPLLSSC